MEEQLYDVIVDLPVCMRSLASAFLSREEADLGRILDIVRTNQAHYNYQARGIQPLKDENRLFYDTLVQMIIDYKRSVRECIASLPN